MAHIFKRTTVKQKVADLKIKDFDKKLAIIESWHNAYKDKSLHKRTEGQCEQAFNDDIFKKVLGYTEYPSQPHTIIPQLSPEKGGQRADAGLGWFDEKRQRVFAVVEIKDVNKSLDRSQQREGNLSPIQQAFKYKPLFKDCRFVIATNFYEIRLFQDNQLDYERFTLKSLCDPANDYFELKKFILLLSAENFVSGRGKSKTEELLSEIRIEQEKISKEFYKEYSSLRLKLMRDIWKNNKNKRDIHLVTDKSQKLLDRIVFVSFCEDTGLLPDNTLHKVFQHSESSFSSVWDTLKGFFRAVDSGSDKLGIPQGYNGGLFHEDPELNELIISDNALKSLGDLGRYDFENELTVNILGHVFEQSISDLEEIKKKVDPDEASQKSKRKKDGIFYTPEYIVDYIVQNSLGEYLSENEKSIFEKHQLSRAKTEKAYREREQKALQEYQEFLHTVKVVDPACGSGAFLVKVFDYLLEENRRVGQLIGGLFSQDQVYKDILKNNIYGVDLNEESVRITQLSLWLKTAQKGKKLTYLDKNIRVGNSLIDDPKVAGEKAFNWREEFKEVFDGGGFDVVVGNPPYIRQELFKEYSEYLKSKFKSYSGKADLYVYFFEQGTKILKKKGFLSYISSGKFLEAKYGKDLVEFLINNLSFTQIINFGDLEVFKGVSAYPLIFTAKKINTKNKYGFLKVKSLDFSDLNIHVVQNINNNYKMDDIEKNNFKIIDPKIASILRKIGKNSRRFSEVYPLPTVGIKTGFNEGYLLPPNLPNGRDYIFGRNVKRYCKPEIANKITFPYKRNEKGYELIDESEEEVISLLKNKERLKKRAIIKDGIKNGSKTWFEYQQINKSLDFENEEYIIYPNVSLGNNFSLSKGNVIDMTCFIIESNSRYLLSLLNSKLFEFYMKNIAISRRGGYREYKTQYVREFPIRLPTSEKKFNDLTKKAMDIERKIQIHIKSFINLIENEYKVTLPKKSITNIFIIDLGTFIEEIKSLNLYQKDELISYYNKKKEDYKDYLKIQHDINTKIDTKIFKIYEISNEDITTIDHYLQI